MTQAGGGSLTLQIQVWGVHVCSVHGNLGRRWVQKIIPTIRGGLDFLWNNPNLCVLESQWENPNPNWRLVQFQPLDIHSVNVSSIKIGCVGMKWIFLLWIENKPPGRCYVILNVAILLLISDAIMQYCR